MNNFESLLELVRSLPELIIYIYPGFLCVYVYYYMAGKDISKNKLLILESVVLSYIFVNVIDALVSPVSQKTIWRDIDAAMFACLAAYLGYTVKNLPLYRRIRRKLDLKSNELENPIDQLADGKE